MSTLQQTKRRPASADHERTRQAADFWALGDYHRIAQVISDLGEHLVAAAGIFPTEQVLDVAAGTGNAALPAARRGGSVTAVDVCPALLATGQEEARAAGLEVRWVEGDAQDLPFPDASFDVVLSSVGAMFAPDQVRTAAELVRVCRPGGRICLASWTPDGSVGTFFNVLAPFLPPVDGPAPVAWGNLEHVRRLLGEECATAGEVRSVRARFDGSPEALIDHYRTYFAPVITAYRRQAGDPERRAALDDALLTFARRENRAAPGEAGHYEYEYLLVRARRR